MKNMAKTLNCGAVEILYQDRQGQHLTLKPRIWSLVQKHLQRDVKEQAEDTQRKHVPETNV